MSDVALTDYAGLDAIATMQTVGQFTALVMLNDSDEELAGLGVRVKGKAVTIEIIPSLSDYTVLCKLSFFIPEPQS